MSDDNAQGFDDAQTAADYEAYLDSAPQPLAQSFNHWSNARDAQNMEETNNSVATNHGIAAHNGAVPDDQLTQGQRAIIEQMGGKFVDAGGAHVYVPEHASRGRKQRPF